METTGQKPTRKCIVCKLQSHNLDLFIKDKSSKYGRRNLCVSCCIERNEKHPKKKDWKTDYQVKKRYGIDLKTYLELMSTTDSCEICSSKLNLCYDHDHKTMKFRGVLCRTCNKALGQLGDTAESIKKALEYLTKSRGISS